MAPPSWVSFVAPAINHCLTSLFLLHDRTQPNAIALVLPTYTACHQIFYFDTVFLVQQGDHWSFGPLSKSTHHRDLYHKQLSGLEDLVFGSPNAVSSKSSLVLLLFLP